MLKRILLYFIVNICLIFNVCAESNSRGSIDIGYPAGIMDVSFGVSFYYYLPKYESITPELRSSVYSYDRLKNTFHRSLWDMSVTSFYFLGKYFLPSYDIFSFFLSAGTGFHYIVSFSDAGSPVGEHGFFKDWSHDVTLKAHGFFGTEIPISKKFYLIIEGRATYPSNIILDSGILKLGINF